MAKRNKTDFLPKRVGRFKIPKRIRRGVVGAAIGSAAGQAVIAALILKAGAEAMERVRGAGDAWDEAEAFIDDPDEARAGDAPPGERAPPAAAAGQQGASGPRLNVSHALGQAALAFVLGLSHPKRPKKRRGRRLASRPAPLYPGLNGTGAYLSPLDADCAPPPPARGDVPAGVPSGHDSR